MWDPFWDPLWYPSDQSGISMTCDGPHVTRDTHVGLVACGCPHGWLGCSVHCLALSLAYPSTLKCSGGLAMMVMNLALPLERFEGFRPACCQEKAYTTKTLAANDGRALRQQSTKSVRGRYGKDDDDNGQGWQRQRVRTTTTTRTTTVRTTATRWQRRQG